MTKPNYSALAAEVHANAIRHGWWESNPSDEHFLCLVACELAEAVEAHRKNKWAHIPNPIPAGTWCSPQIFHTANVHFISNFEERIKDTVEDELADAALRLLDLAGAHCFSFYPSSTYQRLVQSSRSFTENILSVMEVATSPTLTLSNKVSCCLAQMEWLAEQMGIDLAWHMEKKMLYNAQRPYKHGKAY